MKFAYLILGSSFDPARDRASIGNGQATIVGVPSIDAACDVARELADEGVVAIDVCGGFRAEGARRLIEATGGRVCVLFLVSEKLHPVKTQFETVPAARWQAFPMCQRASMLGAFPEMVRPLAEASGV